MRCRGRLNLQQTCSCSLQGDTARCLARPLPDPNLPHDRVDDTAAIALERLDRPDAAALALLRDDTDRPLVACRGKSTRDRALRVSVTAAPWSSI